MEVKHIVYAAWAVISILTIFNLIILDYNIISSIPRETWLEFVLFGIAFYFSLWMCVGYFFYLCYCCVFVAGISYGKPIFYATLGWEVLFFVITTAIVFITMVQQIRYETLGGQS